MKNKYELSYSDTQDSASGVITGVTMKQLKEEFNYNGYKYNYAIIRSIETGKTLMVLNRNISNNFMKVN